MLQRVQMFCLCAGLCLYLGFRFRYFPYSLYTFLSVCKSITALSYDWRLSRYRSFQAWLGVGILFLTDCAVVHLLTWTYPRLVLRTKLHGGNNLAFADFEKIHLTDNCSFPFSSREVIPSSSDWLPYLLTLPQFATISYFTVFRLRDSLLSSYRFESRWSDRGLYSRIFRWCPY